MGASTEKHLYVRPGVPALSRPPVRGTQQRARAQGTASLRPSLPLPWQRPVALSWRCAELASCSLFSPKQRQLQVVARQNLLFSHLFQHLGVRQSWWGGKDCRQIVSDWRIGPVLTPRQSQGTLCQNRRGEDSAGRPYKRVSSCPLNKHAVCVTGNFPVRESRAHHSRWAAGFLRKKHRFHLEMEVLRGHRVHEPLAPDTPGPGAASPTGLPIAGLSCLPRAHVGAFPGFVPVTSAVLDL